MSTDNTKGIPVSFIKSKAGRIVLASGLLAATATGTVMLIRRANDATRRRRYAAMNQFHSEQGAASAASDDAAHAEPALKQD